MPTFLSDPSRTFYLVLIGFFVIALVIAGKNQDRRSFKTLGIATVALLGVFFIDFLVESPREQAVRKIEKISTAINERNVDRLLANVSESFEYKGKKKSDLARAVEIARQHDVQTAVWGFDPEHVAAGPADIEIVFDANARQHGDVRFAAHFRARFVKDPDGQYRLQSFKIFDYVQKEQETQIPGF